MKGTVLLVFFAGITALFYNQFSPFGIALFGQWETSKGVVFSISKTDSVDASIEINDPEIIKRIVQKKERIVLDVRPREIYNQGHLPFAVSFPLMEFDETIEQLLSSINRKSAILVYCSSIECTDSHTFAMRLKNLKYDNVKVFSGGFRQWEEKGYEIQKNE
ncbi:MAG: rhodanese-like domain-containing protein [Proteobacteria bacterium]|nr:rhodanese-like domain-containing protein [Pseudomonadota bacterium]MBU1582543.1 rhodanese-like domain-containing protein [Pseudomonadota bacterium]MBU2454400.1 rhodanese-like domain-containing protein [Pseudomonadota bacterium]MBU2628981.1 rhodanese-like domain-containing protein [Pseudomonadota bacterium]